MILFARIIAIINFSIILLIFYVPWMHVYVYNIIQWDRVLVKHSL